MPQEIKDHSTIMVDSFEAEATMQAYLYSLDSKIHTDPRFLDQYAAREFGVSMGSIARNVQRLELQITQLEQEMLKPNFVDKLSQGKTWSGFLQKMKDNVALYTANPANTFLECQRIYCKFTQIVTQLVDKREIGMAVSKHIPNLESYFPLFPVNTWADAALQLKNYAIDENKV